MTNGNFQEMERRSQGGSPNIKTEKRKPVKEGKGMGSRRIFSPQFKLQVLDSYRQDADCRGNQRATARKYGIHRRQIQKWLQMETTLRGANAAAESGEAVALNLASSRQQDDTCIAGCLSSTPLPSTEDEELNVDKVSDSEDDLSSTGSLLEQDEALDLTCASAKRRFFPISFKLEVIDAFYNDIACFGNLRATAVKFGLHRRQVQKWLNEEKSLRSEAASECLDLSQKKRKLDVDIPSKRVLTDLTPFRCTPELPSSAQETALCLIKPPSTTPEVSSSVELYRPYMSFCCTPYPPPPEPAFDIYPQCCSYNTTSPSCVTKWLHQDAYYYKQAVSDISHYTPLYS